MEQHRKKLNAGPLQYEEVLETKMQLVQEIFEEQREHFLASEGMLLHERGRLPLVVVLIYLFALRRVQEVLAREPRLAGSLRALPRPQGPQPLGRLPQVEGVSLHHEGAPMHLHTVRLC